ncbi:neuronatin isoform X2 [Pteropus alecto]|uniref:neuronatin isoform X2 n=1 Tax=Pteropus alecto TaxID=9402 RepID=UPI000D536879|nr:neuronatin isoform X2 [Pteropus alecto]
MRSAPGYPSLWTPPCAHAQLGGGWLLKARPRRLQQCAQQRTPRDQRPSANLRSSAALALNHPPNALGTMAAVAAASAELLIIGWYIFRVLLQVMFLECCIYWVGFAFQNPPGTQRIAISVQVLPAEAGVHRVEDRAAGVGRAPASPQLRPQPPALGGRVIRCSCASRPAREPVPRRNGGSPVLSRQRSTCQGQ